MWIHSLCILQDNHADWVTESALMQDYHKNTISTMAADAAAGDDKGFLGFHRQLGTFDPGANHPQEYHHHLHIRKPIRCPLFTDDMCLSKRCWTLQEDILSLRIYTREQLVWECQASKYIEGDTANQEDSTDYIGLKRLSLAPQLSPTHQHATNYYNTMFRWHMLVRAYVWKDNLRERCFSSYIGDCAGDPKPCPFAFNANFTTLPQNLFASD